MIEKELTIFHLYKISPALQYLQNLRSYSSIHAILVLLLFFSFLGRSNAEIGQKTIDFYSEKITIQYNSNMLIDLKVNPQEYNQHNKTGTIQNFYEVFEKIDYQTLLDDLTTHKTKYQLNDWFFYELVRTAIYRIYIGRPNIHKRLAIWSMMIKSGFDIRITYLKDEVFLNAYTKEEVYEVPMIVEQQKTYINLSSFHDKKKPADMLYISNFVPNPNGLPFSFGLKKLPQLKAQSEDRKIEFEDKNSKYSFNLSFDKTIVDLMNNYPFITEGQYVLTSFSSTLSNSIIPVMNNILEGKTTKESLETLVAFTRTGFDYKTDEEVYGRSKPMIPEELFHYHFSDCEDRSALFFNLVKELLGLPTIVIAYSDHVTVGVAAPESLGEYILYKGEKYYLCDPTGPVNSYEVGKFPNGYKEQNFEVIASY